MVDAGKFGNPGSQATARRRSDLFALDQIRPEPTAALRALLVSLLAPEHLEGLSFETIAGRRQSALLVHTDSQPVLLFDIAESLVLKRLLELVAQDAPYDAFATVTAAAAGIATVHDSPELCAALFNLPPPREESHYCHDLPTSKAFYRQLNDELPGLLLDWQSVIVDGYILSHEVGHHYLARPTPTFDRLKRQAVRAFEFGLAQVCYEQRPDFEEIAQNYGEVKMAPADLAKIRRDLSARRQAYEADRSRIVEEIACDAHSLFVTAYRSSPGWKPASNDPETIVEGYLGFAKTYFLLFALSDLHQAMIERARLSIKSGVRSEKPGSFAEKHLRKMALILGMAENLLMYLPREMHSQQHFQTTLAGLISEIGAWKACIDALIVMPVTRVVVDHIAWFEDEAAAGRVSPVDRSAWREYDLDLMLGRDGIRSSFLVS